MLKEANNKAREQEITDLNKKLSIKKWEDWFDPKLNRYLDFLNPCINKVDESKERCQWAARSLRDIVYFRTGILIEVAGTLANWFDIIDMALLRATTKETAFNRGDIDGDIKEEIVSEAGTVNKKKVKRV